MIDDHATRRPRTSASMIPDPSTRITCYEVSCVPPDNPDADAFVLTVEWRGTDRWAVVRRGFCLSVNGTWDYETAPSERVDDWLATHRFDRETALARARDEAPKVTVNGHTIADVLTWYAPVIHAGMRGGVPGGR